MTARAFATHGKPSDRDVVAVLLARLRFGEPHPRDLGVGVDRPRHRRVADLEVVTEGVLGGDLALAEARVRELPVAGDVAGGVDVRHRGSPVAVGLDSRARVEVDAGRLEPEPVDERRAADRDEHEVALDGLALAEAHVEPASRCR